MPKSISTLLHSSITQAIIGAFYDTYNQLGTGFLESVYQNALTIALAAAGLKVLQQYPVEVHFRGEQVGRFRTDLLVEGCVMVEIKRARRIHQKHRAQLQNVLKATHVEIGLLLNYGPRPQFSRMILMNIHKQHFKRLTLSNQSLD